MELITLSNAAGCGSVVQGLNQNAGEHAAILLLIACWRKCPEDLASL
jgi:hypothetical protein